MPELLTTAEVKALLREAGLFDGPVADLDGRLSKFEEGEDADPTKHMSPEDAKEWWKHHQRHKDNFKESSTPVPGHRFLTLGELEAWGRSAEEGEAATAAANEAAFGADHDDRLSKFEEGEDADPTKHMSPEDAKEWWKHHQRHRDNFKEAAGGLYGFPKAVQSSCESCTRQLKKSASTLARQIYAKDEKTAAFLAKHAQRGPSLAAEVLVEELKGLGPKFDKAAARTHIHGVPLPPPKEKWAELAGMDLMALQGILRRMEYDGPKPRNKEDAVEEIMNLLYDDDGEWAMKMAREAGRGEAGLYGFPARTARLGLNACVELRDTAGRLAAGVHGRRGDLHGSITGFLERHSSEGPCVYSKLLLSGYPEAGEG